MIVVDAMVLADFLAGEASLRRAAIRLSEEDPVWISCSIWRYEVGNVLWKKVRFQDMPPDAAHHSIEQGEAMLAETVEKLQWCAILDLANGRGLSFYDASYVWLAQSRGLMLRTRDAEILRGCPGVSAPMPEERSR
ncbi:MAG TPA: type II toxin-antitoxin system VapC family toxin [Terrimicrobiaceae bacterium]